MIQPDTALPSSETPRKPLPWPALLARIEAHIDYDPDDGTLDWKTHRFGPPRPSATTFLIWDVEYSRADIEWMLTHRQPLIGPEQAIFTG